MLRGKNERASERISFFWRLVRASMKFFPMFRAVREANKRNEGTARATFRSALMIERAFVVAQLYVYSYLYYLSRATTRERMAAEHL